MTALSTLLAMLVTSWRISHKLHPIIEQYAQLFKTGIRTPALRRPSDMGSIMKAPFFRRWTAFPWRRGSFQLIRTNF